VFGSLFVRPYVLEEAMVAQLEQYCLNLAIKACTIQPDNGRFTEMYIHSYNMASAITFASQEACVSVKRNRA
jgi:hypothetical protein